MPKCSAPECKNSPPEQPGKLYYLFPQRKKSPDVLQQWIDNLGRHDWVPSKTSLVCSDHFHPSCFTKEGQLMQNAVPSLFTHLNSGRQQQSTARRGDTPNNTNARRKRKIKETAAPQAKKTASRPSAHLSDEPESPSNFNKTLSASSSSQFEDVLYDQSSCDSAQSALSRTPTPYPKDVKLSSPRKQSEPSSSAAPTSNATKTSVALSRQKVALKKPTVAKSSLLPPPIPSTLYPAQRKVKPALSAAVKYLSNLSGQSTPSYFQLPNYVLRARKRSLTPPPLPSSGPDSAPAPLPQACAVPAKPATASCAPLDPDMPTSDLYSSPTPMLSEDALLPMINSVKSPPSSAKAPPSNLVENPESTLNLTAAGTSDSNITAISSNHISTITSTSNFIPHANPTVTRKTNDVSVSTADATSSPCVESIVSGVASASASASSVSSSTEHSSCVKSGVITTAISSVASNSTLALTTNTAFQSMSEDETCPKPSIPTGQTTICLRPVSSFSSTLIQPNRKPIISVNSVTPPSSIIISTQQQTTVKQQKEQSNFIVHHFKSPAGERDDTLSRNKITLTQKTRAAVSKVTSGRMIKVPAHESQGGLFMHFLHPTVGQAGCAVSVSTNSEAAAGAGQTSPACKVPKLVSASFCSEEQSQGPPQPQANPLLLSQRTQPLHVAGNEAGRGTARRNKRSLLLIEPLTKKVCKVAASGLPPSTSINPQVPGQPQAHLQFCNPARPISNLVQPSLAPTMFATDSSNNPSALQGRVQPGKEDSMASSSPVEGNNVEPASSPSEGLEKQTSTTVPNSTVQRQQGNAPARMVHVMQPGAIKGQQDLSTLSRVVTAGSNLYPQRVTNGGVGMAADGTAAAAMPSKDAPQPHIQETVLPPGGGDLRSEVAADAGGQQVANLSDYQLRVLLLLLLRLHRQQRCCDYEIGVERDLTSRGITILIKYGESSSGSAGSWPKFQLHVKYEGSDSSKTVCLESFHKFKTDPNNKKFIEFTNFMFNESVAKDGIFEESFDETNPLSLSLLRFKTQFEGREQIRDKLLLEGSKKWSLEDLLLAENYLCSIRFAVGQPSNSEIEGVIKKEMEAEFNQQEHIEGVYEKLFNWASTWLNLNGKNTVNNVSLITKTKSEVDKAFKILRSEFCLHFHVFKPKINFFGRLKEIVWMYKILHDGGAKMIDLVLTGSAGVGKSELLCKYVELYQHEYEHVVVLNAESRDTLLHSLQEACLLYALNGQLCEPDATLLASSLCDFLAAKESLLVCDNADSQDSIQQLLSVLPQSKANAPSIIVISRESSWSNSNVIPLDVFTKEETCAFLRRNLAQECDLILLEQLASSLSCHPLLLQIATSCINSKVDSFKIKNDIDTSCTLEKEINIYLNKGEKIQNSLDLEDNINEFSDPILNTLNIAWKNAKLAIKDEKHGNLALKILELMSFMPSGGIELQTLLLLDDLCSVPGVKVVEKTNQLLLSIVISLLRTFSLIEMGEGKVRISRLLQQVVRCDLHSGNSAFREKQVLDAALAIAANDNKFNEMNYDLNATHFSPSLLFYWIDIFNSALKYKDLVVKYCVLIPKLIFDVIHNKTGCEEDILFSNALFQTLTGLIGCEVLIGLSNSNTLLKTYLSARILLTMKNSSLDLTGESQSEKSYKEILAKQKSCLGNDDPQTLFAIAFHAYYQFDSIKTKTNDSFEQYQNTKMNRIKLMDSCRSMLAASKKLLADNHFTGLKVLAVFAEELVTVDWAYDSLKLYNKLMKKRRDMRKRGYRIHTPMSSVVGLLPKLHSVMQAHFKDKECFEFLLLCLHELQMYQEINIVEIQNFVSYIATLQDQKKSGVLSIFKDVLSYICNSPQAFQYLYQLGMQLYVQQHMKLALLVFESASTIQNLKSSQIKMTELLIEVTTSILTDGKNDESALKLAEFNCLLEHLMSFNGYALFLHSVYKSLSQKGYALFASVVFDRLWNLKGAECSVWKTQVTGLLKDFADTLLAAGQVDQAWRLYQELVLRVGSVGAHSHAVVPALPKPSTTQGKRMQALEAKEMLEKQFHLNSVF